ncbi:MAG TPA: AsmA family protein [Candidatus Eisenbacteria bacterium]|nr:AsmA family protein [Candidatus Eisenbacteria bacterium]
MKKLLLAVVAVGVLATAGLAAFILTFDVSRYRPLAEEKLSSALGLPAKIGRMRLGWSGGVAFEVSDVTAGVAGQDPSVAVDRVAVAAKLGPLLHKKIDVSNVTVIRPSLRLVRAADGSVRLAGTAKKAPAVPAAAPGGAGKGDEAFSFSVGRAGVEKGRLFLVDLTSQPAKEYLIDQADLTVKNLSAESPVDFEGRAALLAAKQNVQVSGRVRQKPAGFSAENVSLTADLNAVDPDRLAAAFPQLAQMAAPPKGLLTLKVARWESDDPAAAKVSLELREGRLSPKGLPPLENASADVALEGASPRVDAFSADFAAGRLEGRGSLGAGTAPALTVEGRATRLALEAFVPASPGKPQPKGLLSAEIAGRAAGPDFLGTFSGNGRLALEQGVILNLNVVRLALGYLSKIPGASERIEASLPAEYRAKLSNPHTIFRPFEVPFTVKDGVLYFENAALISEQFALFARGGVALKGGIQVEGVIRFDSRLSGTLAQIVPEVGALLNAQGQIEIPLTVGGTLAHPDVRLDTQYIFSRVAAVKGQELLARALQGKSAPAEGADAAGSPSYQDVLKNLFK